MTKDDIDYAITKQIPAIEYIATSYGELHLDDEQLKALQQFLKDLLKAV